MGRPAHAARVVEHQRDDGVAEGGVALVLEGERVHGVDHHAGEARRIEDALLEVEIPGAVLLRHQLALQLVGEPADRALQVAQFLVEERPQPLQLVGRREVLGRDLFVVIAAEDLVSERFGVIEHAGVGPPGLARVGHLVAVGIGIELIGVGILRGIDGLAFLAFAALVLARLILGVLAFLLVLGLLLAAFRLLLLLVALLALAFGQLLREIERLEHVAQHAAERGLVVGDLVEPRQRAAGPLLDPGSPQVHHGLGGLRRGGARQPLAHDESERILERRVGALGDLGVAAVPVLVLDARGEVGGHAGHAIGAQRLDARALHRLEHGLGGARPWGEAGVQLDVVAGRRQRQAVGPAADDRHLALRKERARAPAAAQPCRRSPACRARS